MITIVYEKLKFKKKFMGGYDRISVKRNVKKLEEKYQELIDEEIKVLEDQVEEKNTQIENLLKKKRKKGDN